MEFNVLTVLGISLAIMFFGYFFGLFEGRGQGYRKRRKEELSTQSAPSSAEAPVTSTPTGANATAVNLEVSLLSLTRDQSGEPRLDLDGQRVDASQLAPGQRKRLIDLMLIMRPWVEGSLDHTAGISSEPVPAPQSAREVAHPSMMDRLRAATGTDRRPAAPAISATAPDAVLAAKAASPITSEVSMVTQIDAILQTRLLGTPLADLGIRLAEAPGGSVIVFVGANHYSGLGEVPDPEVQATIRAAIAEWERKYTPV
jgi:hypothetical protein